MIFYSHSIEKERKRIGSKLLKEHLKEVGNLIRKSTPKTEFNLPSRIGHLIGVAHDFGKYTTFFQGHLLSKEEDPSGRHHHGLISALFASYLVRTLLKDVNKYMELLAYFVVLHHHGDLKALELDVVSASKLKDKDFLSVDEPLRNRLKNLSIQVEDIKKNLSLIEAEYRELIDEVQIGDFLDTWRDTFSTIDRLSYQLFEHEEDEAKLELFTTTLLLYSLLIDADKRDAADVIEVKRKTIPHDLVDRYRNSSPKIDTTATSGINGIRNEIYRKSTQRILEISLDNHIFTLTAPTGTGKTLTSFSCALKLRDRIKREKGHTPRIIYSLPFISIIEQNYEVTVDVLKQLNDFESEEGVYLVKHHHLADIRYKAEDEERPIDESLLLVESWEAEVIITTFIQLLHSIVGFKNRLLKKYHNIAGSIILLDEVQNIPIEYWPLINRVLKLLVKYLDCYIILLTATKPLIFGEEEAIELLEENRGYFEQLDRITLIPDTKEIEITEFFSEFKKLHNERESYLIVLNTIASSIMFYNLVEKDERFTRYKEEKRLFYLSTNIIPKDRAIRIKKIKELLDSGEKIIVISTQVIEAGIDIDLDVAIRDIGPLDSIIQVAGRCNRAMGEGRKGKVYVFNLIDNQQSFSSLIYGAVHTSISKELVDDNPIEESHFLDLIDRYFSLVASKKDQTPSNVIWDAIREFKFHHPNLEKSISKFSLIKDRGGYIDLFVEKDEEAKDVWKRYEEGVRYEKDFKRREKNYLSIRKDFNSYIISVPRRMAGGADIIDEWLGRIPYERVNQEPKQDYEEKTGFKRTDEGSVIF